MAGAPNDTPTVDFTVNAAIGRYMVPIYYRLASITDVVVGGFRFTHRGRIIAVTFDVNIAVTTAAKATTLTPRLNNVVLGAASGNGGTVVLTSALCIAQTTSLNVGRIQGTAITGTNSFVSGDLLTITASSTTAFAEGEGVLLLDVVNDDTQNAVATATFGGRSANPA